MKKLYPLFFIFAFFVSSISSAQMQVQAKKRIGSLSINGNPNESDWELTNTLTRTTIGNPNNTVQFGVLWDDQYLYIGVTISDASKKNDSQNPWDDDGIEIFIDAENIGGTFGVNDRHFIKEWKVNSLWEKNNNTSGVSHAWAQNGGGYSIELQIPWSNFGISNPTSGLTIGFDIACDDDDNGGSRDAQTTWSGDGSNISTSTYGDLTLVEIDNQPPSAPTNLNASNITTNSLTLDWTASTDNVGVTGYDIYQDNVKINGAQVTGTSYNVSGLSTGTTYSFYVVAFDAMNNSTASSSTNATTLSVPDLIPPTPPTGLNATNITTNSFTLNWIASTDNVGVTGYDIYQNNVKINGAQVTGTSYNVSGLSSGTLYVYYVVAFDASNNSTSSTTLNVTTATPDIIPPTTPSGLNATNVTAATLTLNWTASTDNVGVTGYDVYRNGVKINSSLVTATTYNVTGLAASTQYSFFVNAKDAAGNTSQNSNTINVTTQASAGCTGTGAINFQKWTAIQGSTVLSLTSNSNYPNSPSSTGTLTSFEIPTNSGNFYGMRVYGYICPPSTGNYTFWIASDDNSELWLSTNNSSASKVLIASVNGGTNSREWNKYPSQKSVSIPLTSGQLYYVEALMKEDKQNDNMAVGWAKPGQSTSAPSEVIPGSSLLVDLPDITAPTAPTNLAAYNIIQSAFVLTWTAATDNVGVVGYDVFRNGIKSNTTTITGNSYSFSGLTTNTSYSITVKAKDAAGNQTESSPIVVTTLPTNPTLESFTMRTVIANQRMPHDLVYGPDNMIWYTERFGGTVSFVNPSTGAKTVVLTLGSKMVQVGGQDGLMGLALHPQFLAGKPYVYISYTYQSLSSTVRRTRIERYTYNFSTQQLESPVTVLENIPGSNDHNSSRIAIGPDQKLYYTVGDMGAGQFDNISRTNNAQNTSIYEGKVLRLNTEPDGLGSWVPTDNPFGNAVYTYGHRNAQGLVWGNVNGIYRLYNSEHGPFSDDEINVIEMGQNYGWPLVAGFCDGNYNGKSPGGVLIVNEQANCATTNQRNPLRSLFPATNPPTGGDNLTWPTVAPCGADFYGSTAIPGWQNSLLVAELKRAAIMRLKLSNDGLSIISDTLQYFQDFGRFRDVVVSPDGLKIYVACDSSGSTSGPSGNHTGTPSNPGSILEFTYVPPGGGSRSYITQSNVEENLINKSIDVYPNPASNYLVVYNYQDAQGRVVDLFDISGKKLRSVKVTNLATRIETQNLSGGLYILRVSDQKGKVLRTEKIVINRY